MGELVAVVREDKNGKKTTRWVKGSAAAPSTAKKIPAPAPLKKATVSETPRLKAALAGSRSNDFDKISPRAKPLLEQALAAEESMNKRSMLPSTIAHMAGSSAYGGQTDLNNLAAFYSSMTDEAEFAPFLRGLSYVEGKWQKNEFAGISDFLTQASPQALAKAQAWMYAASRLGDDYVEVLGGGDRRPVDPDYEYDEYGDIIDDGDDDAYYDDDNEDYVPEYMSIYNGALTRLILDHPDKVERIVDDIKTSGISDMALIRERALHPQQALRDGVL